MPNTQHLWLSARQRLAAIDWEPPVSREEVAALQAWLPVREAEESLTAWLQRGLSVDYVPVNPAAAYAALSTITRRAAADGGALLELRVLESDDNQFRLSVAQKQGRISLKLEALGLAIADYADREVDIAGQTPAGQVLIQLTLNALAEAETELEASPVLRHLLFSPALRLMIGVLIDT